MVVCRLDHSRPTGSGQYSGWLAGWLTLAHGVPSEAKSSYLKSLAFSSNILEFHNQI